MKIVMTSLEMQREKRHGKRHLIYKAINNNFWIKLKLLPCCYHSP